MAAADARPEPGLRPATMKWTPPPNRETLSMRNKRAHGDAIANSRKTGEAMMFGKLTLALSLALVAVPASANLVVNGGFETTDFTGWTQVNDTSFSGVTCDTFGGVAPPEGNCQAFFGPVDPGGGGITQDISTVAGAAYNLNFLLANLGNPPNAFGLFWDGSFVSIDFDLSPSDYQAFNVQLTASTSLTTLGFIFYHEPSFFLLDAVVIDAAIPEPASWAMMIAGFALAGSAMRRRKITVAFG